MNRIHAILFDLDGTLLDSAPDLVDALNWVRANEGLPALAVDQMARYVSRGARGLLQAGMPQADAEQFETWKSLLLARYTENSFRLSVLYPGVPEMLDFLARSVIPWGIVTNKFEALTWPILRAAGLADRVSCVVCGDTLNRSKPDPAPVTLACELLAMAVDATLFAGDDLRDIQAGRAAGTMTAAVHYGYGSHELEGSLIAESAQVHHPSDIITLVSTSNP